MGTSPLTFNIFFESKDIHCTYLRWKVSLSSFPNYLQIRMQKCREMEEESAIWYVCSYSGF